MNSIVDGDEGFARTDLGGSISQRGCQGTVSTFRLILQFSINCLDFSLYPDVLPVLELLCKRSPPTPIYIYSSGSVHAQKLLFTHSINDDVTGVSI